MIKLIPFSRGLLFELSINTAQNKMTKQEWGIVSIWSQVQELKTKTDH